MRIQELLSESKLIGKYQCLGIYTRLFDFNGRGPRELESYMADIEQHLKNQSSVLGVEMESPRGFQNNHSEQTWNFVNGKITGSFRSAASQALELDSIFENTTAAVVDRYPQYQGRGYSHVFYLPPTSFSLVDMGTAKDMIPYLEGQETLDELFVRLKILDKISKYQS